METRLAVKKPHELPPNYQTSKIMDNRDQVTEDAHQCHYCTDFAYMSMINCRNCKINYCIWHGVMCGCSVPKIQLIYRFSSDEMHRFKN